VNLLDLIEVPQSMVDMAEDKDFVAHLLALNEANETFPDLFPSLMNLAGLMSPPISDVGEVSEIKHDILLAMRAGERQAMINILAQIKLAQQIVLDNKE